MVNVFLSILYYTPVIYYAILYTNVILVGMFFEQVITGIGSATEAVAGDTETC